MDIPLLRRSPESLAWDAEVVRRLLRLAALLTRPAPTAPDPALADDAALTTVSQEA